MTKELEEGLKRLSRILPDTIGIKHGDADAGIAVRFNGRICAPRFNSEGAAKAYLSALKRGLRKPEYE